MIEIELLNRVHIIGWNRFIYIRVLRCLKDSSPNSLIDSLFVNCL